MAVANSIRLLPDGTPLLNQLLGALPAAAYARLQGYLRMNIGVTGRVLHQHGVPISDIYFPNGGVFSVTNEMRDGTLVEVATVGCEGLLGIGVFLGDRSGWGRTFQQVPGGPFPSMPAWRFIRESNRAYGEAALLPLVTSDRGSCRLARISVEAGVSRNHARRPSSDGHGRHARVAGCRTHRQQVRADSRTEAETPRVDLV
jgi:hypothetical protein